MSDTTLEYEVVSVVRAALLRDQGVQAANTMHGAVAEVWLTGFENHEWRLLVFADGARLTDQAITSRRVSHPDWWKQLNDVVMLLCRERPVVLGQQYIVVHTGANGQPGITLAGLDDFEPGFDEPIYPTGPITRRLQEIIDELRAIDLTVAPGANFNLDEVTQHLEELIKRGEPSLLADEHHCEITR